ncbi:hypothetical protein XENORESO_016378 [Xenotaenia resolanae]|uniref:Uncharacterized protein n=1 Tax=Xenotaenia resolanae TaxID=208358 RepID=A0ABV0X0Y5_9TELE
MEKFLLLLVLAGGCHAFLPPTETKCDANQDTSPCSPVVGGSVCIKLLNNATNYKLKCFKDDFLFVTCNRGNLEIVEAYKNRTKFFIGTGTLKITNVERSDTGQYKVERYNPDGQQENDIVFSLQVKEDIFFILVRACLALGAVLLIVLVVCCICRKKQQTKSKGSQAKAAYENGF